MRIPALFALLLPSPFLSGPALADQIIATSQITAVTVYPQGAQVTRVVTFAAPKGAHDLLITDLPADTMPDLIRLSSPDAKLGAFALRTDRLPPREDAADPDLLAAKATVESAEKGVQTAQATLDALNARMEAADATAGFLRGVKPEGDAVTVDGVKALAAMIGTEVLTARQTALAAAADLPAAQKLLDKAQTSLTDAQDAEAALSQRDADYTSLTVAVDVAAPESHVSITHFIPDASWQPVYDLMLTRKDPSLTVGRGVLVSQYSGEDWAGVNLTLSTAQPSAQATPSALWPDLRRIEDPQERAKSGEVMADAALTMAEPMAVGAAQAAIEGDVVVYHYPSPVDVATGVENLRLALDEIRLTPKIDARAVPRLDRTAFVMASFTNDSPEILLPGQAYLMREGTLVGSTYLETIAPGEKAEVAFGAIDGLRLTRNMPLRAEGDRGILTSSSLIEEQAVLKLENLTDEVWPVRLLDLVPYSEQEDLEITWSADPAPVEVDVEGQRGILAWEFDLAAGEVKEVTLDHAISWPEGKVLQ
jgi:uncharacterized protein (TIGR02231 family)